METQMTDHNSDWHAANKILMDGNMTLLVLLSRLLETVEDSDEDNMTHTSLRDTLFSGIYRVCYRRTMQQTIAELRMAEEYGLISAVPTATTLSRCMNHPAITPILGELVAASALPLTAVETGYTQDSAGFGTCRNFLRLDLLLGTATGIARDARVAKADDAEAILPQRDVSAGLKAPSGRRCANRLAHAWETDTLYSRRNRVESAIGQMKRRFGDTVRARNHTGQINEMYCKVIAHNLAVLVYEIYVQGFSPADFDLVP